MLKKTITYEDYNGEKVSEDFYFHLSKAELIELELSHAGGLSESLQKIIKTEDGKQIIAEFKNIILTSYGKRSEDGRRFMKSQEIRDEFASTEAYSVLFMELVTDPEIAAEFVNGIIPSGMTEEAAKLAGIDPKATPIIAVVSEKEQSEIMGRLEDTNKRIEDQKNKLEAEGKLEPEASEPKIVTRAEVIEMSPEELNELGTRLATGEVKLGW